MQSTTTKYAVQNLPIDILLGWIKSEEIVIPEIQRPFVWNKTKVRDLIDSLYNGFPVGYIITWKNPNVKLKDGSLSEGKKVLIDGQQRITALSSAVLGQSVVDKNYAKIRVKIAFHPMEERFEVLNNAISKNKAWIPDIQTIFSNKVKPSVIRKQYVADNPETDEDLLESRIESLKSILTKHIGIIELDHSLDIDTVTEIFIRINSKGVVLSQADFVMSKIAADEKYGGNALRKCIDYFCHIYMDQSFREVLRQNDPDYAETDFFKSLQWIADSSDEIYSPGYQDVLRVAYTYLFSRGKFADLVSLLSGRNFATRTYEESIAEESFHKLKMGVLGFVNRTNYERFLMCIQSAGFTEHWLIRSKTSLNFSYALFLKLRDEGVSQNEIEHFVKRWFVMASLTGRYSGSAESIIDYDIKQINEKGVPEFLSMIEASEMGEGFWEVGLVNDLTTASWNSSAHIIYIASQIKNNVRGFLSKDITIRDMLQHRGDIHHIFPKKYLESAGLTRGQYNQVANYAYTQQEINIQIGKAAPKHYMSKVVAQCENGTLNIGNIKENSDLENNLKTLDIPTDLIFDAEVNIYQDFLEQRRKLMAATIKDYYYAL